MISTKRKQMRSDQRIALRARNYTYGEMLAFAQFYHEHRTENTPTRLLVAFFKLKKVEGEHSIKQLKLMVIEEAVCKFYGLSIQDVRGKRRYTELVRARQVIAYFSTQVSSQREAAEAFGSDRNNMQYGKDKCATLMEVEPLLRQEVTEIGKRLKQPFADIDDAHTVNALLNENQTKDENNTASTSRD